MSSVTIVNLTPHALNIYDEHGKTLLVTVAPSGEVARVPFEITWSDPNDGDLISILGLPVGRRTFDWGAISGLPAWDFESYLSLRDTVYVVSAITGFAIASAGRPDVFVPGPEVRDSGGNVIGCCGLLRPFVGEFGSGGGRA